MSCVFRVSGSKLPVDEVLRLIPLTPLDVWRAGEPRLALEVQNLPAHESSGFNVTVSEKGRHDLPGQIEGAIAFLQAEEGSLSVLMNHPDVEALGLDFAVSRRQDSPSAITMCLPSELIAAASKYRISVTISQYVTPDWE